MSEEPINEDGTGEFKRFCGNQPEAVQTNDNTLKMDLYGTLNSYDFAYYVADIKGK